MAFAAARMIKDKAKRPSGNFDFNPVSHHYNFLTLFLLAVVKWHSYMGWFRPWLVGIGLSRSRTILFQIRCIPDHRSRPLKYTPAMEFMVTTKGNFANTDTFVRQQARTKFKKNKIFSLKMRKKFKFSCPFDMQCTFQTHKRIVFQKIISDKN